MGREQRQAAAEQDQTHDQIVNIPYPLERLIAGVEKLVQDALGPWEVLVEAVEIHEQHRDIGAVRESLETLLEVSAVRQVGQRVM